MTTRPLDYSTTVELSDVNSVSINVCDVSCEKRFPSEMKKKCKSSSCKCRIIP